MFHSESPEPSISKLSVMQSVGASTYTERIGGIRNPIIKNLNFLLCSPLFSPQMTGGAADPGLTTAKESRSQTLVNAYSISFSFPAEIDEVLGPTMENV